MHESTPTFLLVGWGRGSWGYHSDVGCILREDDWAAVGPKYGAGTTVGVAYDPAKQQMSFSLGGKQVGKSDTGGTGGGLSHCSLTILHARKILRRRGRPVLPGRVVPGPAGLVGHPPSTVRRERRQLQV